MFRYNIENTQASVVFIQNISNFLAFLMVFSPFDDGWNSRATTASAIRQEFQLTDYRQEFKKVP
jgi:hypothetical protein